MSATVDKTRRSVLKVSENQKSTEWQLPMLLVLFVLVIFVAVKTVVNRHQSRTLFMELQSLEKQRDKLVARWSRLKLEQGTLLNQVRVERQARRDLGMQIPKASEIKIVRESLKLKEKPIKGNHAATEVVLSD